MFIAALFTIAKTWRQPKCPSTDEWIKNMSYAYTYIYHTHTYIHTYTYTQTHIQVMEYYSAVRRE